MFLCEIHGVQCGQVFEQSQETLKEQPTAAPAFVSCYRRAGRKHL